MKNMFENAYFDKPYRTRDGRRAIYQCGDDEIHHLFLDSCDILVDSYGYINCKEIPSGLDIVSEWQEDIDEDNLADIALDSVIALNIELDNTMTPDQEYWFQEGYREGYRKAKEERI